MARWSDDAHPELAMERLSFGAGEFGQVLRPREECERLCRNLFAERSKPHDPSRALDQGTPSNVSSSRNPADSVDWVT